MQIDEDNYLAHYGILRRSGRYPWGSGQTQSARNKGFLDYLNDMKSQGLSEKQIAEGLSSGDEKVSIKQLRAARTIARNEQQQAKVLFATRLKDKGVSTSEIGRRMGLPESTVRTLLAPGADQKANALDHTAEMLKRQVAEKKYIDVGSGVETQLGLSKERLDAAVHILKEKGYEVHTIPLPQATNDKNTSYKILAAPGTTWGEVRKNSDQIQQIVVRTLDGGHTFDKQYPPLSIHPDRVQVVYNEQGGGTKDGVIYIRPNVSDLSLGGSSYAQVRIKVGDGHYLKGVAMYKNDLPKGVDIAFNTNKSDTGNKLDAMKKLTDDPNMPFGAVIKRQVLHDPGGPNERLASALNIVNEEGGWSRWSKGIAAQVLSKQAPSLAKAQLQKTRDDRQKEFNEIMALNNPTVKKKLLETFADGTDSTANSLKAAAVSSDSRYHIILPVDSLSPSEVYAPNFPHGSTVVLIRYPHGGTFEIPELKVNNRHPESKQLLGTAPIDAVGINHQVAQKMSGADFDGDFVLVIPNNDKKIKATSSLEGLKGLDPMMYKWPDGVEHNPMSSKAKAKEMGQISNLITDMTIRGAPTAEIARAIRHSMVVIDGEKHDLNYKQSALDNGIKQLELKYQIPYTESGKAGSSTLISRSRGQAHILDRKERPAAEGGRYDRTTGAKVYVPTGKTKTNRLGQEIPKTIRSTKLAETQDAHTLSSGTTIEKIYADHSNELKALANRARLESLRLPPITVSASAKKTYANEVKSLDQKLNIAKENRPIERQAQIIAGTMIKARFAENPNLPLSEKKKIKNQCITVARNRVGASKSRRLISITPEEWNAIQAGAISNYKLTQILANADMDQVRSLATPHHEILMPQSKISQARDMMSLGYTRSEVAKKLGVSVTTLNTALAG
jgi:DNA-binding CsgD family transcriptional regulator